MMQPALDPEMAAFVARTEQFYPAAANAAPPAENRAAYDRMCAAFRAARPAGVQTADTSLFATAPARELRLRRYRGAGVGDTAVLLYLHGGGFILGGLDSHDDVCAELCQGAAIEVASLDYRLAPEHPYPAALDDTEAAYRGLLAADRRIVVGGDSAGGNLTAALCLRLRRLGLPQPAGQLLIYPGLGGSASVAHAQAPLLSAEDSLRYRQLYAGPGRAVPVGDSEFAPLRARDFRGLPPAAIFAAAIDPLCEDAAEFAARLRADGVQVTHRNEPGLVHGYLRARHASRRAAHSFGAIIAALRVLAQ
ncbi:MAG TPA: alpha/beta hydrolase [Acetobacteraceae bacterium]